MIRVLIVDHETATSELVRNLSEERCRISAVVTCHEALALLRREEADIIMIGTKPSGGDGVNLLRRVKVLYPTMEIIMLIHHGSVDVAVQSMKLGAYDCIVKPVDISRLSMCVHRAYETKLLREKIIPDDEAKEMAQEFVGESGQIREIKKLISLVGPSRVPVLILGETGTGKEVVARAIHRASDRSSGPFVTVNASALPDGILESELFGYRKGAFTGAVSDKAGLLDIANRGTFFADEVGDVDLATQAKLLRIIETGTFRKLGDTRERKVNVRLVCATNRDLEQEVKEKHFRADLYYRLSTFIIRLPPLRERREDIPLLIDYFLSRMSKGGRTRRVSLGALDLLVNYAWPGNIRQVAHVLERACILSSADTEIGIDALPFDVVDHKFTRLSSVTSPREGDFLLNDVVRQYVGNILEAANGNKSRAARLLGISRSKLYAMLGTG